MRQEYIEKLNKLDPLLEIVKKGWGQLYVLPERPSQNQW